jgi:hypothetical protein
VLVPKKMRPLVGVRGIVGAAPDWRRRGLGQGRAVRCTEARRPRAGWIAVRPAMGRRWGGQRRRRMTSTKP